MLFHSAALVLLLSLSIISGAQQPLSRTTVLPAPGLQADVQILRSAFEQLHPGLYRYNSRQQMDAAFDRLEMDFGKDQTLEAAFLRLSAFTAEIRCGHTYPSFFNQSDAVTAALFQGTDRLPFFYRWMEGQMIVTRDFTPDHHLPPGTSVESIDGIATGQILQRLLPLVRADGANDGKRIDLLQVQGTDTYEAADILLPMVFRNWTTPFTLVVRTPGRKKAKRLTEQAVSFAERKREAASVRVDPKSGDPLFTLRYLSGGEALLIMPTWVMYQSKWDWRTWLNGVLDEIVARRPPALVIDLRGNEGGDDVGQLILDRLPRTASAPVPYERLVGYRKVPAELNPFLKTWDKSFKDWGDRAVELPEPWPTAPPVPYLRQLGEDEKPSASAGPAPPLYSGKVFVLTDAANSSATYGFARIVQMEHLGKLAGQPTGGNKRGTNGGAFFFVGLPHAGLEVDLPLIGYFPPSNEPDQGLQPDILVPQILNNGSGDANIKAVEDAVQRSLDRVVR